MGDSGLPVSGPYVAVAYPPSVIAHSTDSAFDIYGGILNLPFRVFHNFSRYALLSRSYSTSDVRLVIFEKHTGNMDITYP
jgi:hypothetical protein